MDKAKTEKRTFKYDINLIYKGIQAVYRLEPKVIPTVIFSAIFTALTPFINIYLSARIIDELLNRGSVKRISFIVGLTIGLNLLVFLISKGLKALEEVLYNRLGKKEELDVCSIYLKTDYDNLENPEYQGLRRDYAESVNMRWYALANLMDNIENLVKGFFTLIISLAMSISLFFPHYIPNAKYPILESPVLSVIMLLAIVASVIISFKINQKAGKVIPEMINGYLMFNRIFGFYLSLASNYKMGKEIRIYNQKKVIMEEGAGQLFDSTVKLTEKIGSVQGKYDGITGAVSSLLSGLVYIFVALKALIGVFSIGGVVQYVGAINQFTSGFANAAIMLSQIRTNNQYLLHYLNIIDTRPVKYKGTIPVEKRDDNDYEIQFKNVSFKYPGTENYALKDLSLKLKIGERLAVVGTNGSGKSTFIKLLCRLYDPTEGEILLNGIDIKKYDYDEYMKIFSVVFQDFKLFSFPLGQNVGASVEVEENKAKNCLIEAGFEERLKSLNKGLNTPLYKNFNDDGVEVSGGEAQKIAIARALYKDSPFIVLDEPTAALDPISEYEIYSKFNEIVNGKTAIYISHRLSSCRFCNDIAVFNEGKLIQRGSHDELVKDESGKYYELWNAQAQYYK